MGKFGKRELNKARTRLDILHALYRLSEEANFRDIKVTTLAESVSITEVTFFNYFQKKEDILKYMMGVWALDLVALQQKMPLTGEAAIRRVFRHTAEHSKKHPRLIANFVASLLTSEVDPLPNEVDPADRFLLYPDSPELLEMKIPNGNEIILQHLAEIDPACDPMGTLIHLASCLYGDMIVASTAGLDIEMLYTRSLDLIFKK